jgi:hypothetical protein
MPETLAPNPINPYGRSKLMSEWMLADAAGAEHLQMRALTERGLRRNLDQVGGRRHRLPGTPARIGPGHVEVAQHPVGEACSAPITPPATAPACATTSRSRIWPRRISPSSTICAAAATA